MIWTPPDYFPQSFYTPLWRHNTSAPAEEYPRALRRNLSDRLGSVSSGSCRFGRWKFLRPLGRPLGLLGGCTVVCTVVENGIFLEVGVGPGTMPGSSYSSTPCLGLNCSTCHFQVGPFGTAILTRTDALYITGLPDIEFGVARSLVWRRLVLPALQTFGYLRHRRQKRI